MKKFKDFIEEGYDWYRQEGESEVLHHATYSDFDHFNPLSHFGSKQAARKIATSRDSNKPPLYKSVRIKLGNTVEVPDFGDNNARVLSQHLLSSGHINIEQHKDILNQYNGHYSNKQLAKHLRDNGIHTLKYTNKYEDPGHTSYMITHPSQVRVLRSGVIHKNSSNISTRVNRDSFGKSIKYD